MEALAFSKFQKKYFWGLFRFGFIANVLDIFTRQVIKPKRLTKSEKDTKTTNFEIKEGQVPQFPLWTPISRIPKPLLLTQDCNKYLSVNFEQGGCVKLKHFTKTRAKKTADEEALKFKCNLKDNLII